VLSEAQNEPITNWRCLIVVTSAPTSSTMPTHSCPEGTDHRDAFVVSWAFSSDLLGGSCHAELVAFRGQHDYVVEDPPVIVFPPNSGAACNKLGHLGSDQSLPPAMSHGPLQPRGCRYGARSSLTSPPAPAATQSQEPCPRGQW
jgi:hypothetical protein